MEAVSLLLVDPHPCTRQAIHYRLAQEHDLIIKDEADAFVHLPKLMQSTSPRIVILDVTLLDQSSQKLCYKLRVSYPQTAFIFLSPWDWDVYLAAAWQADASAFVVKTCTLTELLQTVRAVAGAGPA